MRYDLDTFDMFDENWKERLKFLTSIIIENQFYDYKNHSLPNTNYKLKIVSHTAEDGVATRDTLNILKRLINNVELE